MRDRLVREAKRNPRLLGVLLFSIGLIAYGLVTSDREATVTGLVIAALVVIGFGISRGA